MAFPFDLFSIEILLPFFLVLAIVYGALEVSKVFDNKGVKGIIAAVFAFFSVMNSQVVDFINTILPYAAGVFVVLFLVWMVIRAFRGGGGGGGDPTILIIILVLILVLLASLGSSGWIPSGLGFLSDPNLLWIIGVVVFLIVIYKAYKMGSSGGQ